MYLSADLKANGVMDYLGMSGWLGPMLTVLHYTDSFHFIVTELYGSMVLSNLFLNFFNESVPAKQLIRFFPLIIVSANIGLICSGLCGKLLKLLQDSQSQKFILYVFMGMFVVMGALCFLIRFFIEKTLVELRTPLFHETEDLSIKKQKRSNLTREEEKSVLYSPLTISICLTVIGYGLITNLVESAFKASMKELGKASKVGSQSTVIGLNAYVQLIVGTTVCMVLLTPFKGLIKVWGYKSFAFISPVICLIGALLIFGLSSYNVLRSQSNVIGPLKLLRMFIKEDSDKKILNIEVFVSCVFVSLIKVSKYAAFDICKEVVSSHIDSKYLPYIKTISDSICGKFGKASGSLFALLATMLMGTSQIRDVGLFALVVVTLFIFLWFYSIIVIGKNYNRALKTGKKITFDNISDSNKN